MSRRKRREGSGAPQNSLCNCKLSSITRGKLNPLSRIGARSEVDETTLPQTDLWSFYKSLYANDDAERDALVDFARTSSDASGLLGALRETFELDGLTFEPEDPLVLGETVVPRTRDVLLPGQRPSYVSIAYGGSILYWTNVNIFVRNGEELAELDRIGAVSPGLKIEFLPSSVDPRFCTALSAMPKISNAYRMCVFRSPLADPFDLGALVKHVFANLRGTKVIIDSRFNDSRAATVSPSIGLKKARYSASQGSWSTLDVAQFVVRYGVTLSVQKHLGFEGRFPVPPNLTSDYHEEKLFFHARDGCGDTVPEPGAFLHRGLGSDILSDCGFTSATERSHLDRTGFSGAPSGRRKMPKIVRVVVVSDEGGKSFARVYPKRCFTINGYLAVTDDRVVVLRRGKDGAHGNIPVAETFMTASPTTFIYERSESEFGVLEVSGTRFYVPYKRCLIDTGNAEVNAIVAAVFRNG